MFIYLRERRKGDRRGETDRQRHQFVVPLIYAFIGWFLYVPWPGIKPATLACQDDAPTNWATQPVLDCIFHFYLVLPQIQVSLKKYDVFFPHTICSFLSLISYIMNFKSVYTHFIIFLFIKRTKMQILQCIYVSFRNVILCIILITKYWGGQK